MRRSFLQPAIALCLFAALFVLRAAGDDGSAKRRWLAVVCLPVGGAYVEPRWPQGAREDQWLDELARSEQPLYRELEHAFGSRPFDPTTQWLFALPHEEEKLELLARAARRAALSAALALPYREI